MPLALHGPASTKHDELEFPVFDLRGGLQKLGPTKLTLSAATCIDRTCQAAGTLVRPSNISGPNYRQRCMVELAAMGFCVDSRAAAALF